MRLPQGVVKLAKATTRWLAFRVEQVLNLVWATPAVVALGQGLNPVRATPVVVALEQDLSLVLAP